MGTREITIAEAQFGMQEVASRWRSTLRLVFFLSVAVFLRPLIFFYHGSGTFPKHSRAIWIKRFDCYSGLRS